MQAPNSGRHWLSHKHEFPSLLSPSQAKHARQSLFPCHSICSPPCSCSVAESQHHSETKASDGSDSNKQPSLAGRFKLLTASHFAAFNLTGIQTTLQQHCGQLLRRRRTLLLHVSAASWTGAQALHRRSKGTHIPSALQLATMPCATHIPVSALERSEHQSWASISHAQVALTVQLAVAAHMRPPLIQADENELRLCSSRSVFITHSSMSGSVLAASRAALVLGAAGCNVSVLHGGMHAWAAAGGRLVPLAAAPFVPHNATAGIESHPVTASSNWPLMSISHFAREAKLRLQHISLVDVRSWEEFTGSDSGYNYLRPAAALPSAIWGRGGGDATGAQDTLPRYWDSAGYLWAPLSMCQWWRQRGMVPSQDKPTVLYCGTAWRAAAVWLAISRCFPEHSSNLWVLDGGMHVWLALPDTALPPSQRAD